MVEGGSKRLYVGNLFPEVTSDELKARFERFGSVESAEVKHKTDIDGNPIQTFAFVNIVASADSIDQCINAISNSKWKGYAVKVQQAKESFMSRLQRERQNKENWSQKPPPKPSDSYDPIALFKSNIPAEGENEGDNNKTIKQPVQTKVPKGIKKSSANYEKLGSSDIGKEENGVIDFSGASNKKNQPKGLKRKLQAYHSSDEEEGGEDAPIKKKKKPPVIGEGYDPLALVKGKKPGDSPSKRKKKFEEDGNKKEEKEQVKESMEEERQRNLDMINKIGKNEEEKQNKKENFKSRKENYDREKPRKKFENKSTKNFMPRFDPEADTPEEFNAKLDGQGRILIMFLNAIDPSRSTQG